MGDIRDIVELVKELESRAKERKDIEIIHKIQVLINSVLADHVETVDRDIRLLEENSELRRQAKEASATKFIDECEFLPKLGVYKHRTKPGFFCGSCTSKNVVSPLRDTGHGWECQIQECDKFHADPDRPSPDFGIISV